MAVQFLSEDIRLDSGAFPADSPSVGGNPDGSWFAAWEALVEPFDEETGDSRFSVDIYGRAFVEDEATADEVLVNAERRDGQFDPQVVARADGSYVVAYSSGEENRLPGTYIASRNVGNTGSPYGTESLERDTYDHKDPDVAVLSDGGYIAVATSENGGDAQVHAADGTLLEFFSFGWSSSSPVTISPLGDDEVLLVWLGFEDELASTGFDEEGNPVDSVYGLHAQPRAAEGTLGTPFLVAPLDQEFSDFSARLLGDGRVAVVFTQNDAGGDSVFLTLVDTAAQTASTPVRVDAATAGAQSQPEIAVLDTGEFVVVWTGADGAGSGVIARVFQADGSADGAAFVVVEDIAGAQSAPSVAAIGGGRFVVAWQDAGGVEARVVADVADPPSSPLFSRAGTIDLTPAANQVETGIAGANSVFADVAALSGQDRVTNFGANDVLLLTAALPDSNGDGLIGFGRNGLLDLDGAGPSSDTVRLDGVRSLRALGQSEGLLVYADARVRPGGAIEGALGDDTLAGTGEGDVFFLDTALGAGLGDDRITGFGTDDLLVLTTQLADRDGDGVVGFGSDRILETGQGSVAITAVNGRAVESLEYDGSVVRAGVTYYVYSRVGSAADEGDVFG